MTAHLTPNPSPTPPPQSQNHVESLLTCPFCGSPASEGFYDTFPSKRYFVACESDTCPAEPEIAEDSKDLARRLWNQRSAQSLPTATGSAPEATRVLQNAWKLVLRWRKTGYYQFADDLEAILSSHSNAAGADQVSCPKCNGIGWYYRDNDPATCECSSPPSLLAQTAKDLGGKEAVDATEHVRQN